MRSCILMMTLALFASVALADDPDAKAKRDRDAAAALELALKLAPAAPAEKAKPSGDAVVVIAYGFGDDLRIHKKLPVDATHEEYDKAWQGAQEKARNLMKTVAGDVVTDEPLYAEDDPADAFLIYTDVPLECKDGKCRPLVATAQAVAAPIRKAADCACTNCDCGVASTAAPLTYRGDGGRARLFQGHVRNFFGRLFRR